MKKALVATAVATTLLTPLAHAEKIGVTMANSGTWLTLIRNSVKAHAANKPGVELQIEDARDDINRQINQVQSFIAQKVDAIIVTNVDMAATPKITKLATAAGIPLVYLNHPPAEQTLPPKVTFVGSNDTEAGALQTKEVCRLLGGKGNILLMNGDLSNQSTLKRTQSVKDVIGKPPCNGMKIVGEQTANWSRIQGSDLMMKWLSAGTKFDAVVANNDEMALGAIQALKSARKFDKTALVAGVDATKEALASMKAGELKVTVLQDADGQAKMAVDAALKMIKGQKVESKIWVPFELVTPANMSKYLTKN